MKFHNRWAATVLITVALGVLSVAGTGAHAAPLPVITVSGVIASSVTYTSVDVPLVHDLSSWFGKSYTLQMTVDATGAAGTYTRFADGTNRWTPNVLDYSLTIDGAQVASGSGSSANHKLETINSLTFPASTTGLPPGVIAGSVYDHAAVYAGFGKPLVCQDGMCDSPGDVELLHMGDVAFQYFWDTANGDAITSDAMPDLLSGAPYFTGGFGNLFMEFDQWNATAAAFEESGILYSSATSVSVVSNVPLAPVPLPAAAWLFGSGLLGLVGVAKRKAGRDA